MDCSKLEVKHGIALAKAQLSMREKLIDIDTHCRTIACVTRVEEIGDVKRAHLERLFLLKIAGLCMHVLALLLVFYVLLLLLCLLLLVLVLVLFCSLIRADRRHLPRLCASRHAARRGDGIFPRSTALPLRPRVCFPK
jgi:Flp pilus assembly protein TadB